MRVLVVGGGAREHALAWKLAHSPRVDAVLVAPGNAGTATVGTNLPVAANDIEGLARAAEEQRVDLTVVGPEEPLARGIVDTFQARGLAIAGPTAAAARIESSKAWAKDVMAAAGVPTAAARTFTDLDEALAAVQRSPLPIVVKASGLAAGKGVVVARTREEAEGAVRAMLGERALGEAGSEVLLEDYLEGREVSLLVVTDGDVVYPLLPARDYKRLDEGDTGPNTGGMGAYAPVPGVDARRVEQVVGEIVRPTLAEMAHRGVSYRGVLYAGLILTADGPKVLEFNCRFGDPEAQVILPLMSSDLAPLLEAVARGRLADVEPPAWRPDVCVGVVVASGGYPGHYRTGLPIHGLDRPLPPSVTVFQAGTQRDEAGQVTTAGGRVLTVVATAGDFHLARERVYRAIEEIGFEGARYRRDIASPAS